MHYKSKRSKATGIPTEVKKIVAERDCHCCIFCGKAGLPEAHVIGRAQGGLGVEQNIVTACRTCHNLMDNSDQREQYVRFAKSYLHSIYPDWNEKNLVFNKWEGMKWQ